VRLWWFKKKAREAKTKKKYSPALRKKKIGNLLKAATQ